MSDSNHSVRNERLAGRYSYLEREGLLPLPVQDGITVVVELRYAAWAWECLNLLQQHSGASISLIGVAMDTDFPLQPLTEAFPGAAFIPYEPGKYGVNEALAYAGTSFVALLEDRVMVTPGWVGNLLWPFIDDPSVQVAAPRSSTEQGEARERLHFGTEQELSAYVTHSLERRQGEWHEAPVLCGSCLVFTRELLQRIGGFDSTLVKRQLMVADWCLRARQRGGRLVLSDALYVHSLQPLLEARAKAEHEGMQDGVQAYLAKWGLDHSAVNVEEGILPVPPDVSALPPRPGIMLEKSTAAPVPLVTAVVYSERPLMLTPEEFCESQKRLQGQQSYGNIRWVWIRDSRRDALPEYPVREQDAVIAVQGEDSWLHALENVAALYDSEIVVYLSASADYDSHYVKRIAEAVLHGSADLVVSRADSAIEEPASVQSLPLLIPVKLPLERIAHRSGSVPGRITRQKVSGHGLQLEPQPSLAIGYIGGPPEANILTRCSGGEVRL
ncbi:glycosyltransferase family protein [Paenibacillus riograndensis]|uniref:Glycosyltransferase 2-like domain-containing protein n=1 Tax=Paenibacillus riograndensis SBR5 TaxID=1073571 RepID=A0A0E4HHD7_9BACL|nr:hypothetical protein [Paenibacillus riograndensis]CQR58096.1 hypothetical protein PRIO_5709 [Paenibacillus riograndensis SBR5]